MHGKLLGLFPEMGLWWRHWNRFQEILILFLALPFLYSLCASISYHSLRHN